MSQRHKIHVTSAGIQIGAHYIPKPPEPSRDAELIQRALLTPRLRWFEDLLEFIDECWPFLFVMGGCLALAMALVELRAQ